MRVLILISILVLSSCELPWQRDAEDSGSYGDVVRTVSPGGNVADFGRTLNDMMSGPTNGRDCHSDTTTQQGRATLQMSVANKSASSKKGEPQVYWDECNGGIKGNYIPKNKPGVKAYKCTKRKMSKDFMNFMNKNFSRCVKSGLDNFLGNGSNVSLDGVNILHEGIKGDRRHSKKSYHYVHRAIDISIFQMKANGKNYSFNMQQQKRNPDKKFFDGFRSCWAHAIKDYSTKCPGGRLAGTIGHEDGVHVNHMHISLPYCQGVGAYQTGFYTKGVAHNH